MQALEVSFSPLVIRDERMIALLFGSLSVMDFAINRVLKDVLKIKDRDQIANNQIQMRELLSLDVIPFEFGRRTGSDAQDLPKDDERRLAVQALFLFILRPHIPLKYEDISKFTASYNYSMQEQERLRVTANWMDLAFYTLMPKNNKTFLMNLVPRICEGRYARYVYI